MRRSTVDIDPRSEEWNELWSLFGAYLYQDYQDDHGSPAATVHAFCRDSTPEQRKDAADEVRRILDGTDD
jgi:hypothetical protein